MTKSIASAHDVSTNEARLRRDGALRSGTALAGVGLALAIGAVPLVATEARAQEWLAGGVDNTNYNEPTNWTNGVVPTAGSHADFSESGSATIVVNSPVAVHDWHFYWAPQNFSISGSAVTINGSLIHDGASGVISIANDLTGAGFISIWGGTINLSGNVTLTGPVSIWSGTLGLSGGNALGDTAPVLLDSAGILDLTNSEEIGSLAGSGQVLLGTNTLTTGGNNTSTTFSGLVTGTGRLAKVGTGIFTLSGANTYSGGTTISAGTLVLNNAGAAGTGNVIVEAGGALVGNFTATDGFGSLAVRSGARISAGSGQTFTINQIDYSSATPTTITYGSPGNNGVLVIDGGSSTSEPITHIISHGTLRIGSTVAPGALFNAGDGDTIEVQAGAALDLNNNTFSIPTVTALTGGGNVLASGPSVRFGVVNTANVTFDGNFVGGVDLIKSGAGTFTLTGANTAYTGSTLVSAGTLALSGAGSIANSSSVTVSAGATFDISGVNAPGASITTLAGAGVGAVGARTLTITNGSTTFSGGISGSGGLTVTGGTQTLTGDSSGFAGTTSVAGGTLIVGVGGVGSLGGTLGVLNGGTLGGSGTVGTTVVSAGGTVAAGNSIGTLRVAGDITFAAGSRFDVEVDPAAPASDLIHATGSAFLNSGSVVHIGTGGNYGPTSTYTILTADGGVVGTFADVSSNFAFLDPKLLYGNNDVRLKLDRNDITFDGIGETPNQRATARGVETIGSGNAVYDAVLVLDNAQARAAFDQLSGEIHASIKSVQIENSHHLRDAATNRIRAAFEHGGSSPFPILGYGPDGTQAAPAEAEAITGWGHVFGSWGHRDGNGNATRLDRSAGGILVGADRTVGNWKLGLLAGYSYSSFAADVRSSSGHSNNIHLGLYGGTQWGALAFRAGAAYSRHMIQTSRSVTFPGFTNSLEANYGAGTAQVFGEFGYTIEAGQIAFEPFAGLAYVNLGTDGFTETGGAGAITSLGGSTGSTVSTLGVRVGSEFMIGGMRAKARGMLGWRHAYGNMAPISTHTIAGSNAFAIAGVPMARDAALVELGLDLNLSNRAKLGFSYDGQFDGSAHNHSAKASFSLKF